MTPGVMGKRVRRWTEHELPDGTVGVRLVRMVGDELREYEAIHFPGGAGAIAATLNRQFVTGSAIDTEGEYGLVDLLDEDQNILDDIGISDSTTFQRLRQHLGCRVVPPLDPAPNPND